MGELEALVARHPLRESLHRHLTLALYRAARQADALAAYERFRRRLDEELGIEPSPPLKALQLAILKQDSSLEIEAPRRKRPRAPRAGDRFVGRERELGRLVRRARGRAGGRRHDVPRRRPRRHRQDAPDRRARGGGARAGHDGAHRTLHPARRRRAAVPAVRRGDAGVVCDRRRTRALGWRRPARGSRSFEARCASSRVRRCSTRSLRRALIVLEDLQWADASTLDLVAFLGHAIGGRRILLVGTYRSEEVHPGDPACGASMRRR